MSLPRRISLALAQRPEIATRQIAVRQICAGFDRHPQAEISAAHPDRNGAIVAAYTSGAYSYREIAEHFGIHLATVGRIVRKAMQQCEN